VADGVALLLKIGDLLLGDTDRVGACDEPSLLVSHVFHVLPRIVVSRQVSRPTKSKAPLEQKSRLLLRIGIGFLCLSLIIGAL
jgi:hypothetical protein